MRHALFASVSGYISVVRQTSRLWMCEVRSATHGVRDPGWVHARSGGGPCILAVHDALAGEETVDDTVRVSAAIGFGGLLLRCPGGAMRSVKQSPEVAVLRASPDPGDRRLGAFVFEHLSTEFSSLSSSGWPRALATARCAALREGVSGKGEGGPLGEGDCWATVGRQLTVVPAGRLCDCRSVVLAGRLKQSILQPVPSGR